MNTALLAGIAQDLRYAARSLSRSRGFTLLAVLILALGIGANTAVFSLVSGVLLRPLPFEAPDRLVVLWEDFSALGGPDEVNPAPANYVDWKARARSFEDMALLQTLTFNLTGDGEPERLDAMRVETNLFSLLGLQPLLGRTFSADDEGPNTVPVAVLGENFWVRRFGADPDIVGRTITLDGLSRTVIGVVPSDFKFPFEEAAIWVPAAFTQEELAPRGAHFLYAVARLADGTTLDEAQAEMTTIARALEQEYPSNASRGAVVTPLHEQLARTARPSIVTLLAAVGAVLLITCANVANLLLARGTTRRRELAVRKALGAGYGRVARQLLTESALLAVLGVAVGVALCTLSFDYLARLVPGNLPEAAAPALDWRVLSFTGAIALLTVLLFGAGPALAAARLEPNAALKRGVSGGERHRANWRNALVVAEITLTVVLLAAAGLLLRSYAEVLAVDTGFEPDNLLVAETVLAPSQYGEPATRSAFYRRVLERVNALPGVTSAGYANYAPLMFRGGRAFITIEGRPPPVGEAFSRNITSDRVVSEGYFQTLGVPLIAGRHIDERDVAGAPLAVVINEAMARLHWPGEDAIGARLRVGGPQDDQPWYTVVGIVGDMRQMGLATAPEPEMYFSFEQAPFGAPPFLWPQNLVVRTQGDPMALAAAVRDAVWAADPNQPVSNIRSMREVFDVELTDRDTQMTLVGTFAGLALLLASVGLYGVLSYAVAQRTSEIGLRMALGAQPANVVAGVLRSALLLGLVGIGLGLAFAFGLTRLLASFLFGVSATDPATFAAVSVLLLAVTIAASYVPARRAASIDPLAALRAD